MNYGGSPRGWKLTSLGFASVVALLAACSSSKSTNGGSGGTGNANGAYSATNCPNEGINGSSNCVACLQVHCPGSVSTANDACGSYSSCICPDGANDGACGVDDRCSSAGDALASCISDNCDTECTGPATSSGSSGGSSGGGSSGGFSNYGSVGESCSPDGLLGCVSGGSNQALQCKNGTWAAAYTCPGLQQCFGTTGGAIACGDGSASDLDFAVAGAPCATDNIAACSFDLGVIYWCEQGTWTEAQHCPPSTCTKSSTHIQCANAGLTVGDQCTTTGGGNYYCSTDLTAILACSQGTTIVSRSCPAGTTCGLDQNDALNCN